MVDWVVWWMIRLQVVAFLERLSQLTSRGQSLLQLSSKYATVVHEDPAPMRSATDFQALFRVRAMQVLWDRCVALVLAVLRT